MNDTLEAVEPVSPPGVGPSRAAGALAGVASVLAGLAAAELVAAISSDLRSPVVSIGERFIDLVPAWLKDLAIAWFGTNDKAALIVGILALLAGCAAAVGVWTVRHGMRLAVSAGLGLGLVGVVAALQRDRDTVGWVAALPSVVAVAVTLTVLAWLTEPARHATSGTTVDETPEEQFPGASPVDQGRRRLLVGSLAVGAVAVGVGTFGRTLQRRFSNAAERAALLLPGASRRRPPAPADPASNVEGLSPLFTPNDRFFRIDTALVLPSVSLASWQLRIHGMVEREVRLTFDELLALPLVEADVTLSCVSNEVGGSLVGNARWLGVRLDDLLNRAGVLPDADQIIGRSVDNFTAGFPVAALDGRDALVAVGMNGEPLPQRHGFPARLVVPGLYGYVSATKWLSEIELTRFDQVQGYWIPRGWSREGPIKTQSRIDRPGTGITAGPTTIAGVAWAPTRGIAAVDVQVDDEPWRPATLGPSVGDDAWVQWWIDWDATPGRHQMRCRAIDGTGELQVEERTPVAPDGATGWHTRRVTVE